MRFLNVLHVRALVGFKRLAREITSETNYRAQERSIYYKIVTFMNLALNGGKSHDLEKLTNFCPNTQGSA